MNIELYISLAANGLMLKADPSNPTPDVVMMDFVRRAREARAMILGRVTYELALALGAGDLLGGVTIVVISRHLRELPGAEVVASPAAAVARLRERQHERAVLAGGAAIYSAFLAEALVDEVTINVLPLIASGAAIAGGPVPQSFELVTSTQLPGGIPQLTFRKRQ